MKLKIANACLLLLCFAWLAALSGAVPVLAEETGSAELVSDAPAPTPDAERTEPGEASPPNEPAPAADTPAPAQTPASEEEEALPEKEDGEDAREDDGAEEAGSDTRIIAATLTSDELIDNDTYYNIDAQTLLDEGTELSLSPDGYQVLIIHTHATEAYTPDGDDIYVPSDDYRTTDTAYSVVRVGEELARALGAYGISVLHDAALYDYPSYNGSYVRCGEAIEEYLAAYPGISLVIDLHRDALGDGDTIYKTVTEAEGLQAAQIMFVMGSDVNLEHPNWQENLKLALTLQAAVQSRYETLMRPTTLCDYRYNQQLSAGSLLMEVGTAGNTLQEAINAVKLFADAAGPLLASRVSGG